jgi:hypothetical protein
MAVMTYTKPGITSTAMEWFPPYANLSLDHRIPHVFNTSARMASQNPIFTRRVIMNIMILLKRLRMKF